MGTRADFYVGRGESAQWLGSIAWDGYPAGIDNTILFATGEYEYRKAVAHFFVDNDGTTPDMGWPWPWDDSQTTDYAYAFDDGRVWGSSFGHKWFVVDPAAENYGEDEDDESDKSAVFPDMSGIKRGSLDRSGFIVISAPGGAS